MMENIERLGEKSSHSLFFYLALFCFLLDGLKERGTACNLDKSKI